MMNETKLYILNEFEISKKEINKILENHKIVTFNFLSNINICICFKTYDKTTAAQIFVIKKNNVLKYQNISKSISFERLNNINFDIFRINSKNNKVNNILTKIEIINIKNSIENYAQNNF